MRLKYLFMCLLAIWISFVKCFSQFYPFFYLCLLAPDVSTVIFILDKSEAKYRKSLGREEFSQ